MSFELLTRTGTGTVGSVICATDYDASAPPPTSEAQVTAYAGAIEDVAWSNLTCPLDPSAIHATGPRKYIRDGNVAGDITAYDGGKFFVCTTGFASNADISKLWVNYTLELLVPQIVQALPTSSCYYYSAFEGKQSCVNGATTNVNLSGVVQNTLAAVYDAKANTLTLPKGAYQITYSLTAFNGDGAIAGFMDSFLLAGGASVLGSRAEAGGSNITGQKSFQLGGSCYYATDGTTSLALAILPNYPAGNSTVLYASFGVFCV